jgi:hypothetical protein
LEVLAGCYKSTPRHKKTLQHGNKYLAITHNKERKAGTTEVHTYSYSLLVQSTLSMNEDIPRCFILWWDICIIYHYIVSSISGQGPIMEGKETNV